ncbi:unnamed protein product [Cuscuta epithymum]|uniref:Pectin acetylesterase n=1 Tax=Cuscuta epithymum TaxID=186058 RepID=A0AAV0E0L4_9ASTE|nr:unnamed protein product [Cuscuta epithymum]CAH9144147.1 unnamed protein product [Cuscuta epithymum]
MPGTALPVQDPSTDPLSAWGDYFVFKGIFSDKRNESYFYHWNRVIVRYCDDGSFSGDVDQPDPLFYRGARIYRAVVKELMAKGMKDAKNVILAEGSAGGIGAMIHSDHFRSLFHPSVNVKCYIDSSLFLKLNNPKDAKFFKTVFGMVVKLQPFRLSAGGESATILGVYYC